MRETLLEILACPTCRAALTLTDVTERDDAGGVETGTLTCDGCHAAFPVVRGVPRLLPLADLDAEERRTGAHFAHEFTALAEDERDIDPPEVVEYYFFSRTGIDPLLYEALPGDPCRTEVPTGGDAYRPDHTFLEGKRVLDAGCGPARFTKVAATAADQVIALDLGDHVDRARAATRHLGNVEVVQGSVLQPPFRRQAFDYVFSVGVLQHTPDAREGVLRLADLVPPDGAMSVWVYGPEYWNGPIRGPIARAIHRILSRRPPEQALRLVTRWLYPLGRLQMVISRRRLTKLLAAPLFVVSVPRHPSREVMIATIFDYYCPPIITTHTYDEVRGWLEDAGFQQLRPVPVPTAWFAEGRVARVASSSPT